MAFPHQRHHLHSEFPHAIGTDGNTVWENGEWSCTIQGQSGDPIPVSGYWSSIKVREGGTWKIRLNTIIHTPQPSAPAATASPASMTNSSNK
jgi:ketosteroid isomerase-like protein